MSFGWSAGDVIAGLKVLWDIYSAVSDGPLNAEYQAQQFYDEFILIISRLEIWEERKPAFAKDAKLEAAHQQLKSQCVEFIKRHMRLIQGINPKTIAKRHQRSTWLQRAPFNTNQVKKLYQQVTWPAERKEVAKLQRSLHTFLTVTAVDIGLDTNQRVREMR